MQDIGESVDMCSAIIPVKMYDSVSSTLTYNSTGP